MHHDEDLRVRTKLVDQFGFDELILEWMAWPLRDDGLENDACGRKVRHGHGNP